MKIFDKIRAALFSDNNIITEQTVKYYEDNPDELDLIINKEYFNSLFLLELFFIGIATTFIARIIQFIYEGLLGEFINTVIIDVISELGIAIFGGAVVAYLIEYLNKKQYQQNIIFRSQVKAKLKEREGKNKADNNVYKK